MAIEQPNQVWCADITYILMAKGFVYLVAVMDWFSRRVLAWRLSTGMDTAGGDGVLRLAAGVQHGSRGAVQQCGVSR